MPMQPQNKQNEQIIKSVFRSIFVAIAMFGFAFALIPIYDVICDITGLNGKTGGPYEYDKATASVDFNRVVRVRFITNKDNALPLQFKAVKTWVDVHPGEAVTVDFYARNDSSRAIVTQAIPSLVPTRAVNYFHKTECFCFEQQKFEAGQELNMPMRFIVDRNLPARVKTINLSYTMYDITDQIAGF